MHRRFSALVVGCAALWVALPSLAARPRLELELEAWQYRDLLAHRPRMWDQDLQPVLDAGKRFLDWVTYINQFRDAQHRISLSSAQTQPGYPIDQAHESNGEIVAANFSALKKDAPEWLTRVVLNKEAFPKNPPVSDADFIGVGFRLNQIYEAAARWQLEQPYMDEYIAARSGDVRGYYFLAHEKNLETELGHFKTLPSADKERLKEWLLLLCFNTTESDEACASSFDETKALAFFHEYEAGGKALWDSYFAISSSRDDVDWTSAHANQMNVPFATPPSDALTAFLKDNIEDEWRWNGWALHLDFTPSAASHLEFEPGATPHVNTVAGNTITMDANAPLTEYGVQWAIRHEYGHVIGFTDCYVEFYDEKRGVMVSYQLDLTNLMCSRKGHLLPAHYEELKRVYFKE